MSNKTIVYDIETIVAETVSGYIDDGTLLSSSGGTTGSLYYASSTTITTDYQLATKKYIDTLYNTIPQFTSGQTIWVSKAGSDSNNGTEVKPYLTINRALDDITLNSSANTYSIRVSSGIYIEDTIILKSYVSIVGDSYLNTVIEVDSINKNVIEMQDQSYISNVQLQGATASGQCAILYDTSSAGLIAFTYVENVRFGANWCLMKATNSANSSSIQTTNLRFGGYSFNTGFWATGTGSGRSTIQLRNIGTTNGAIISPVSYFAKTDWPLSQIVINGSQLNKAGTAEGTCLYAENGGSLRITSTNIRGWAKAIEMPNIGASTNISAIAMNFENNTLDADIQHPTSTGKISGADDYSKINITNDSSVFVVNQDARILTVAKKGGNFTSIAEAIATISDATPTNQYLISVGPGEFSEPQIDVPSYVSVKGSSINSTIVSPAGNHHGFTLSEMSEISFLSVINVQNGYSAFYLDNCGDFGQLHKISIYDSYRGIWMANPQADNTLYCEYVDIAATENAVYIQGSSAWTTSVQLENFYTYNESSATGTTILIEGENIKLDILTFGIRGSVLETGIQFIGDGLNTDIHIEAGFIENTVNGIIIDGNSANLKLSSIAFEDNGFDLRINDSTVTGNFTGYIDYSRLYIDPNSLFFITNKNLNIIEVASKGADFTSVKTAIDSIDDNSSTNRYIVKVGPGIYNEHPITCKPYVNVIGESQFNTIVNSFSGDTVFIGAPNVELKALQISGALSDNRAVTFAGGGTFRLNFVRMANNNRHIKVTSTTAPLSLVVCSELSLNGVEQFQTFIELEDNLTNPVNVVINSFNYANLINITNCNDFFLVDGNLSRLTGYNVLTGNPDLAISGNFVRIADAGKLILQSTISQGFNTFTRVDNTGSGPDIRLQSVTTTNCTNDIIISNPTTVGSISGSLDETKISIVAGAEVSLFITDPTNASSVITGKLIQGSDWNTRTDVTDSIKHATNMGVGTGGVITSTGLTIGITAGDGYLVVGDSPDEYFLFIEWSAQTLNLSASTYYHIWIDENGLIQSGLSRPNILKTILLGQVRTTQTNVQFIQDTAIEGEYVATRLDDAWRTALGNIFRAGCIVTENVTPLKLDISSGEYWYSIKKYTPSSTSAAEFTYFWQDSGMTWQYTTTDTVPQIWNASGQTFALGVNEWVKHSLYVLNDGSAQKYLMVIGQEIFTALIDADTGPIPTPPSFFAANCASIAAIVVSTGSTIDAIKDIRPTLAFKAESGSVSSTHGNLQGLDADDHVQYLLINGTRSMSGTLNMNTNAITNVTTVNSVTVQSHGSRHTPNGLDPLPVGVPVAIGTSLQSGTTNTYALADHVHIISNGFITDVLVNAANKDGLAGTASLRTLGTGSQQAAAGDHTHVISGVTGLQTALDSKVSIVNANAHIHDISAITGLQTSLNNAANTATISGVTGLQSVLNLKVDTSAITEVVYTGSTQTIINKTLLSATNTIEATRLRTVNISSTLPFRKGQKLVYDGTNWTPIFETTGQTLNATPITGTTIVLSEIPQNQASSIEVYVSSMNATGTVWGNWKKTISIIRLTGNAEIKYVNADYNNTGGGLKANSIDFSSNSSGINIILTGIAATTLNWKVTYEIK